MIRALVDYAAGRGPGDQPLTEAARVALEANPTPRVIKMAPDHDGTPIEIPEDQSVKQQLPE